MCSTPKKTPPKNLAKCLPTAVWFQVQGLNSQWQKYDSSREDYIRGLCQRLKSVAATPLAPSLASAGAALLHQEISRLNGLLEDKLSECARLRGEAQETSSKDRERIQTLEQQVGVSFTTDNC